MDDKLLTRREHEEFEKRMEAEHKRLSHRLEILENLTEKINDLAISTNSLAESVARIANTQKDINSRLNTIEDRDGEYWRKLIGYIITAAAGLALGLISSKLGL